MFAKQIINYHYTAPKTLMKHAYTQDEILNCKVSGKRANSNVENVKPAFTPMWYNKIRASLHKKIPEALKDPASLTKREHLWKNVISKKWKNKKKKRHRILNLIVLW